MKNIKVFVYSAFCGTFICGLVHLKSKLQSKHTKNNLKESGKRQTAEENHDMDINTFIVIIDATLCTFLGVDETTKYLHRLSIKMKEDPGLVLIFEKERDRVGEIMKNKRNNQMDIYDAVAITHDYLNAIGFNDTLCKLKEAKSKQLTEENVEMKSNEFYYISTRLRECLGD